METLRSKDATRQGMSRATLQRHAQTGEYDRIARGIYRIADAAPADHDLIDAATRRPDTIVCLTTALAHHDLVDDIPDALDLAIPRTARPPATHGAVRWHRFDTNTFTIGREDYPIPGTDLTIGIYSPERCIVDAFRLRSSIGYESGPDALRTWLGRGGKPAALATLARQLPRSTTPLMRALDLLT